MQTMPAQRCPPAEHIASQQTEPRADPHIVLILHRRVKVFAVKCEIMLSIVFIRKSGIRNYPQRRHDRGQRRHGAGYAAEIGCVCFFSRAAILS
jgi:hypothetical protein